MYFIDIIILTFNFSFRGPFRVVLQVQKWLFLILQALKIFQESFSLIKVSQFLWLSLFWFCTEQDSVCSSIKDDLINGNTCRECVSVCDVVENRNQKNISQPPAHPQHLWNGNHPIIRNENLINIDIWI